MGRLVQKVKVEKLDCSGMGFGTRVETGAVEFTYPDGNTDWSGYYIRGDDAMHIAIEVRALEGALKSLEGIILPEEKYNEILWHLNMLVSLKDDVVTNAIVGGAERFPSLKSS